MHHFITKLASSAVLLLFSMQLGMAQTSTNISIRNEKDVNSKELEFSPTFYKDGIVFISTNTVGMQKMVDDRIKKNTMSIVLSRRGLDGKLTKPQPFDEKVTTRYHEGPVCFNAATDLVYFSRNAVENGKEKLAKDGDLKMDIYTSSLTNGQWDEGKPLSINSLDFDDCHPVVSLDGDKLIFASNREGGFGGMDLYLAYRTDAGWSEPINLGAEINTAGNEAFPFLHADNTLYFASNGLPGAGNLDIFSASYNGTGWMSPTNLGTPFNSTGDDFGLIVDLDKKNGYFSSNGLGGEGQDDIFSFHAETGTLDGKNSPLASVEKFDVVLKAMNTKNELLSKAKVRVVNMDRSNVIGKDAAGNPITLNTENGQSVLGGLLSDAVLEGETDSLGMFAANLGSGNYLFTVSKDGYESKQGTRLVNKPSNVIEVILDQANANNVRVNTVVTDSNTKRPLSGAMVVFTDPTTGAQNTVYADENGVVDVFLPKDKEFKMEAFKNGQSIGTTQITPNKEVKLEIATAPAATTLPVGTIIELPNIYYNFNDAALRPDAVKDLDMVLSLSKQYPDIVLEIGSHTDSRGSHAYNEELSQARAESVVSFLVANGIPKDRLRAVGYGERQLRNSCTDGAKCGETQHARNRRTEIKVVSGVDASTEIRRVEGSLGLGPVGPGIQFMQRTGMSTAAFGTNFGTSSSLRADAYYVVSGAFLSETNAENRLLDLLTKGYSNAQIAQFDGSPFYFVFVGKHGDFNTAMNDKRQFVRQTREDAFVKSVHQSVE